MPQSPVLRKRPADVTGAVVRDPALGVIVMK
jgi:hypothetical protein